MFIVFFKEILSFLLLKGSLYTGIPKCLNESFIYYVFTIIFYLIREVNSNQI